MFSECTERWLTNSSGTNLGTWANAKVVRSTEAQEVLSQWLKANRRSRYKAIKRLIRKLKSDLRRGGRVVEGARLESVYTLIAYRGFESLSLRQLNKRTFLVLLFNCGVWGWESSLGLTNRQDRRFAQPKVTQRVSYMDVANESLSLRQTVWSLRGTDKLSLIKSQSTLMRYI